MPCEHYYTINTAYFVCITEKGISSPSLPRRKRMPKKFEIGMANPEFPCDTKKHYLQLYNSAFDCTVNMIKDRFDQSDQWKGELCEEILVKSLNHEDCDTELKQFTDIYQKDFPSCDIVKTHLNLMSKFIGHCENFKDVHTELLKLSSNQLELFPKAVKLVKLLCVLPATTATCERVFSSMRFLKNYLRNKMGQRLLNTSIIAYLNKAELYEIDLDVIVNDFITSNPRRKEDFGLPRPSVHTLCHIIYRYQTVSIIADYLYVKYI